MSEENFIHPTSIIIDCKIGSNVSIGPFCFLSNTSLGDNVVLE
ncbi:hypothetical protein H6768_04180 [Candidatus Peribacteria bacterium]|nr:hypothetical protein [Candidatus Peribacteria bacterium]